MTIYPTLAVSVLSLWLGSAAIAVPLPFTPPYTFTTLPGTTLVDRPELAGTVIADTLVPYLIKSGGQQASGNIQERIVRETASGTLDFYWKIAGDALGALPVTQFRVEGFQGYVNDGDWRIDSFGNEGPETAVNFGTGAVNFLLERGIAGTDESNFFFLRTTATRYTDIGRYDLVTGAGFSGLFATFAPTTVPEPTQWVLMIGGFVLVGGAARRQRGFSSPFRLRPRVSQT